MEGFDDLDMSLIVDGDDLSFEESENLEDPEDEKNPDEVEDIENTEDITAEMLDMPESVGGPEKTKRNTATNAEDSSPDNNTYSSIASAFKIDGVPLFSDADDEEISKISTSEEFEEFLSNRLQKYVDDNLEDSKKRINDALKYGVAPTDIQVFENSLANLEKITEDAISDETENGRKLREQLIYTDLINRGFSEERAKRKTQQSFDNNTDIEDAKDALESNKTYYQDKYDELFNESKANYEKAVKERKEAADKFKRDVLEGDKAFGEVKVDKKTRQQVFDVMSKPIGKDKDGRPITAIQKYADENPSDFRKFIGYFYVVTNGFKDLNRIKDSVKNEVTKKEISALERTLNSTARNSNGTLKFMGNTGAWNANNSGDVQLIL